MIFPDSNGPGSLPPQDKGSTIPPGAATVIKQPGEKWTLALPVVVTLELDAVDCPTLAEAQQMALDLAREQPLVVTLAGVPLTAKFNHLP